MTGRREFPFSVCERNGFFAAGVYVRGEAHARRGLPCQDYCGLCVENSVLLIAVADGLGSARFGGRAARFAVAAAVTAFRDLGTRGFITGAEVMGEVALEIATRAGEAVRERARKVNVPLFDFDSTLLVILADKERVGTAHLGDGGVVIRDERGLAVLSAPPITKFVNEVDSLSSNDFPGNIRVTTLQTRWDALAAFTDGCQSGIIERRGPEWHAYSRFFEPLFSFAKETRLKTLKSALRSLLKSHHFTRFSEDDRTLVVALRRG